MAISVSEAEALIRGLVKTFPSESIPLWEAAGRVLREPLRADSDYPRFDRVCMDGYALRAQAFAEGRRRFAVGGLVLAGEEPPFLPAQDACLEVMTGAALPGGCDAVIPVEEVSRRDDVMEIAAGAKLRSGQHIHPKGRDYREGEMLLSPGRPLSAPQLALAAALGCSQVKVACRPRFVLIVTGDELVPVESQPRGTQIRMTHPFALMGMLRPWADLEYQQAADTIPALRAALEKALREADGVLITGGVSAGRRDLVPEVLASLGAESRFHKVRQRPGKPMWLGESRAGKPVFAFPGNPVAATLCARKYFLPWLWNSIGMEESVPLHLPMSQAVEGHSSLTLFMPVRRVARVDGGWEAVPCVIQGSGDFAGLALSQGFVEIPEGAERVQAGESLRYFDWSFP